MKKKGLVLLNGEPWTMENNCIYPHVCCDCNLAHLIDIQIDHKKKKAKLRFYRDDHRTKELREKEKIVVYRRKK